jgi:hypothetical protein
MAKECGRTQGEIIYVAMMEEGRKTRLAIVAKIPLARCYLERVGLRNW